MLTYGPFILAGLCGVLWLLTALAGRSGGHTPAARHLRGSNGRQRTSKRLGVDHPGLPIGRPISGGRALLQDYESTSLDLGGPRSGKTTCRVIPMIIEAPGPVVSTSNKRDALDHTRVARSSRGEVWVFDPMAIADEPPSWWWNPLSAIVNEARASELAGIFAAAVTDRESRSDAFFEGKGRRVVTALLLAAASSGRTIDATYHWVVAPRDDEPVDLLREHGHELLASSLVAEMNAPDKQRAGVFSSAERLLTFLTDPAALRWVTPGQGRTEFRADAFVQGAGTLYALSREGADSASALVAALTATVANAAEQYAKRSPGGRLPVPMVLALDEVANIVRWPALPALFSHYGSRGIILACFAQSWSQLEDAFGRTGARTMWGAATIRVVGAGVGEADFLEDLSRLVGDFDERHVTRGQSRGGRSTTQTTRRRRIMDVSELASMPKGRALVLMTGAKPVLARMTQWWKR